MNGPSLAFQFFFHTHDCGQGEELKRISNRFLDKLARSDTNIKDDIEASEDLLCGNFTNNTYLEKPLSTNPSECYQVRKGFNTSTLCFLNSHVVHDSLGIMLPSVSKECLSAAPVSTRT